MPPFLFRGSLRSRSAGLRAGARAALPALATLAAGAVSLGALAACGTSPSVSLTPEGAEASVSDDASPAFSEQPDGGGPLATRIQRNGGGGACGSCAVLLAQTQGGKEPYSYAWSDPSLTGPGPFQVCPGMPTSYSVTVTDSSAATGELAMPDQTARASTSVDCSASDGSTSSLNGCAVTTNVSDGGIDAGGTLECTAEEVGVSVAYADGGSVSATVGRIPGGKLLAGHAYQFSYDRLFPFTIGQPVTVDVFGSNSDDVCKAGQLLFTLNLDGSIFNWHQAMCFTPDRDYEFAITRVYIQGVLYYFNALATGTLCDSCSTN
jgi:hypothetical protein